MSMTLGDNSLAIGLRVYEERRQTLIDDRDGAEVGDGVIKEYVMLIKDQKFAALTALKPMDDMASSNAVVDTGYADCQSVEEVHERLASTRQVHANLTRRAKERGETFSDWSSEWDAADRAIRRLRGEAEPKETYAPPSLLPRSVMLCEFCPAAQITGDRNELKIFCDSLKKWTFTAKAVGAMVELGEENLAMTYCAEHTVQIAAAAAAADGESGLPKS